MRALGRTQSKLVSEQEEMRTHRDATGACAEDDHVRTQEGAAVCVPQRETTGDSSPVHTGVSDFQPPDCKRRESCCLSVPGCRTVPAGPGDSSGARGMETQEKSCPVGGVTSHDTLLRVKSGED